jgi:type II secretory pathway predicted ATPase ExeA
MPQVDGAAFRLTPDLRFLFSYGAHEEAFAKLTDALRSGQRLLLITGPFGVGKTLLLRRLEASLAREGIPAAYAAYPQLDFAEMLASIAEVHGTTPPAQAKGGVVLLDDADRCSSDFLQNLQDWIVSARGGPRALRFVLAGSPSLPSRLTADFPTLNAMVGACAQIEPLSDTEADAYIRHRLEVSGQSAIALQADARDIVIHYSRGIPRLINHACARALLLAGPAQPLISQEIAREAIEDYFANASFGEAAVVVLPPVAPAADIKVPEQPPASTAAAVVVPPAEPSPAEAALAAPAAPAESARPEPPPEPAPVAAPVLQTESPVPPADARAEAPVDSAAPESPIEIPPRPAPHGAKPTDTGPTARKPVRPNRLLRSIRAGGAAARPDVPTAPLPKFAGFRQRRAPRHDQSSAGQTAPIGMAPLAGRRAALKRMALVAGLLVVIGAALYAERTPDALSAAMRNGDGLARHLAEAWRATRTHALMLMNELRRIAETLKI